jgi:predicted transcriptional regulator
MKDHLSLRLPTDVSRALSRRADAEHTSRSAVVREAVARYLAPTPPSGGSAGRATGRELAERWRAIPHLTPAEAEAFAADLDAARKVLTPARSAWE